MKGQFDHNRQNSFKNIYIFFFIHTSERPEQSIVRLYKDDGLSCYEISKRTGARWERVKWTIDRYTETNQIPSPKKRGRPPKNTTEVNKFIIDSTFQDRFSSCKSISDQMKSQNIAIKKRWIVFFSNGINVCQ